MFTVGALRDGMNESIPRCVGVTARDVRSRGWPGTAATHGAPGTRVRAGQTERRDAVGPLPARIRAGTGPAVSGDVGTDGNYEVGGLLGRGGMGEVRLARHRSGRLVAIKHVRKTLSLDPLLCERLTEEARVLRRIHHPNVVAVLDGGTDASGPYLVMERAYGAPLDEVVHRCGPMTRARITAIASQLLAGLIAIHDAGVIHADLKSSNILIDELDRATIIDFGLARVAAGAEQHEILGGTPAYMAPEVLGGATPDIASDLFSTGVIIYEMLTGTTPLARRLPATVIFNLRLHAPVELPSTRAPDRHITAALDAVMAKVLDRDPACRYPSAYAFANALSEALAAWDAGDQVVPAPRRSPTSHIPLPVPTEVLPTSTEAHTLIRTEHAVITRVLDAASALVAERDLKGAADTLEAALASLAPADPTKQIVPEVWRIQTVLAALYQSLGMKDRAMRHARVAIQNAQRTSCKIARARANAVMTQIQADQTRIARGSRQVPLRARQRP